MEEKDPFFNVDGEFDDKVDDLVAPSKDTDELMSVPVPKFEATNPQKFQNPKGLSVPCTRHPSAHPKGGYLIEDKDGVLRKALGIVLKEIGLKIIKLSFANLLKVSRPAMLSFPSSYLHAVLRDFQNMPKYLIKASQSNDPAERIKLVMSGLIAGMSNNLQMVGVRGFLNPILGQTLQAVSEDGETRYYAEQTCHHPPISHFCMTNPRFEINGYGEVKAGLSGLNTIKAGRVGRTTIKVRDPEDEQKWHCYDISDPKVKINGIVSGDRIFSFIGGLAAQNKQDGHSAEIALCPPKKGKLGALGSFVSGMFSSKKATDDIFKPLQGRPSDFFLIRIFRRDPGLKDPFEIEQGFGSWLESIGFQKEQYWNVNEIPQPFEQPSDDHILPSDANNREDLLLMLDNKYKQAQTTKEKLENIQRKDKANRIAQAKKRAKKS